METSIQANIPVGAEIIPTMKDFTRWAIDLGPNNPVKYGLIKDSGRVETGEVEIYGVTYKSIKLSIGPSKKGTLNLAQVDSNPSTAKLSELSIDADKSFSFEFFLKAQTGYEDQGTMGVGFWNNPFPVEAGLLKQVRSIRPLRWLWLVDISKQGVSMFKEDSSRDERQFQVVYTQYSDLPRFFVPQINKIPFVRDKELVADSRGVGNLENPNDWHKYGMELRKGQGKNGNDKIICRVDGREEQIDDITFKGEVCFVSWVDNNKARYNIPAAEVQMQYCENSGREMEIAGLNFAYIE